MRNRIHAHAWVAAAALAAVAACATDAPTGPTDAGFQAGVVPTRGKPVPSGPITGERIFGNVAIEPAFNADTGELMYLLTPIGAPNPSKANSHAVSPLYIVMYPPGSTAAAGGHYNCEGVPGNCPDHAPELAALATGNGPIPGEPGVYGTDPEAVPGHDHVGDPPGGPDFNVAWEVVLVLFTNSAAADTRLTTDAAIEEAVNNGDAVEIDLGFAFNCSVVPESLYWRGQPVENAG